MSIYRNRINIKKLITLLLVSTPIFTLTARSDDMVESANTVHGYQYASAAYDNDDEGSSFEISKISYVTLDGNSIGLIGVGAIVEGRTITITSAGLYNIRGTLNDGQIIVDSKDKKAVNLILEGAAISCPTSAPIYVINAKKTVITLADGTENFITDGDSYIFEDAESDEPNAAIFSKDDLTIKGNGSLTVNANFNNGIQSKDDLKITGGNISVNAVNDGIKGIDSITIKNGNISVNAGGNGFQSNKTDDPEKGYVSIEGGTINITSAGDGIHAETNVMISGGNITISSGGGSGNSSSVIESRRSNRTWDWGNRGIVNNGDSGRTSIRARGIKAGGDLTITGGTVNIDSSEDSLNSNNSLKINGGNIILASGDDGIRSTSSIEINGGNISITKCYEGFESSLITINDGNISLLARDDGINVVGSNNGTFMGRQRRGFAGSGDNHLNVNGGYIAVDAYGDGIDINGPINMTGGILIVNGPTSNRNGPLDYSGSFKITGGFLVAVGSSGMAQAPSTSSTQYSVMVTFSSQQPAGTIIHIETEDGKEILTFVPTKAYQSIVLSSPELKNGSTYIVYSGGSLAGKVTNSLYSGGTYTAGTQIASFTISSIVTFEGSYGGGFLRRSRW